MSDTAATIGLPVTITLDPDTGHWTAEIDLSEAHSALADLVADLESYGADSTAAERLLAAWPVLTDVEGTARTQIKWVYTAA